MYWKNFGLIMKDIRSREISIGKDYYEYNKGWIDEYIKSMSIPSYVNFHRESPLEVLSINYGGYSNGIFIFDVKRKYEGSTCCYAIYISMDELELYKKSKI